MSTVPPSYDAAMAQLKQLQDKGVSDAVKEKAQAAIADELAKPETAKNLLEEVKKLGDSAIKIDQAFERVKNDLGKVDQNNYKDKNGKPIAKLQPTWIGYQKRYTKILWDSRNTATKTEAYIKDFLEVVLPGVEELKPGDKGALEDAIADLEEFMNRKDPNSGKINTSETGELAKQHSQEFTDLRRDIESFKNSFDSFAKDQKDAFNAEINRLKGDISKLEAEIKQYETVVMAMGIALGVTVFATAAGAVGALAGLGPLGPIVAVGVLIVGAIAAISELGVLIAYIVKTNDAKAELEQKKRDLKNVEEQLATLIRLQAMLKAQEADINDICARLDSFAKVWSIVAHDATMICEGLKNATTSVSSGAFKRRLRIVRDSYTALQAGLREYATMVDQSNVPKPSS